MRSGWFQPRERDTDAQVSWWPTFFLIVGLALVAVLVASAL